MSLARQFLREMRPLFRMLDEPFARPPAFSSVLQTTNRYGAFEGMFSHPAVDVTDQGDKFIVDADLPGVPKENVEVRIGDNGRSITIEGKVIDKVEKPAAGNEDAKPTPTTASSEYTFCIF